MPSYSGKWIGQTYLMSTCTQGLRTWCAPTWQPQPFDLHVCSHVNAASRLGCATIDVMAQSDNEPADDDDHDGSTATGRAITAAQTCVVS